MSATDDRTQLDWESRFARPAALAAFGSAACLVLGFFGPALVVDPADDAATTAAENSTAYLAAAGLQALAAVLLAFVLYFLYRASKARVDRVPAAALVLVVFGPLATAAVTVALQVERVGAASEYVAQGDVTEEGAQEVLDVTNIASEPLVGVGLAGTVALALALVLISLNAMRAGLFSRFLGIFGIVFGVVHVIQVLGPPVIFQVVWSAALGFLFLDRWPGGRGPAWDRVEAVPWPTAAQRMEAQQRERMEDRGLTPKAHAAETSPGEVSDRPRPASRKRRRGGRT